VNREINLDGLKRLAVQVADELEALDAMTTPDLPVLILAKTALTLERCRAALLRQREAVLACKASVPPQS
jgi:hypothetical protein